MAFNTSDPKFQKALLVVLVLAGACYGYWAYIMVPKQEAVSKAEREFKVVTKSVQDARAIVAAGDTAALRMELEKRQQELALAQRLLPDSEDLPMLLRTVTRTGEFNNLNFLLFEPQAPNQYPLYQERAFKIKIRGGYHETARFLSEMAGLDMIFKPTRLSMLRDSRPESPEGETVTSDVTLTTYLLIAGPKVPANQQQKGK